MAVYAIGDLHLPGHEEKQMNVFGAQWDRHFDVIAENWRRQITPEDIVLIPGDISWAMQLQDAMDDLRFISELPGKKLLLRGNHDYWWSSIGKVRPALGEGMYAIQNDAIMIGEHVFCGSRGWTIPMAGQALPPEDEKIFQREQMRLTMSLECAMKWAKGRQLTVMTHYPPLMKDGLPTAFTDILERYPVNNVVYGHLHGVGIKFGFDGLCRGISYKLVSCDAIGFCPVLIG